MTYIWNLVVKSWRTIILFAEGLWSLIPLTGIFVGALFGGEGSLRTRLFAALTTGPGQRLGFAVLRALLLSASR